MITIESVQSLNISKESISDYIVKKGESVIGNKLLSKERLIEIKKINDSSNENKKFN